MKKEKGKCKVIYSLLRKLLSRAHVNYIYAPFIGVTPPWKNFLSAFKKEVNDRNEGVRRAKQYRIVRDTRYEQHIIQQFDPLKPPPPLFNDNGARKRTHLSSETTPPSSIKTKTRRS